MEVIPAIDVLDEQVVRLWRGDFTRVTVYGDDPVGVAREWMEQGARLVHVVDLAAARSGSADVELSARFARGEVRFQIGGGIRDVATAQASIASGAHRVVVGTAAVEHPEVLGLLIRELGGAAVVVALDVKAGRAMGSGWTGAGSALSETIAMVVAQGVERVLVTAITRDGTMGGPDLALLDSVREAAPGLSLIASGGVGSLEDVTALAATSVESVIVGRALYEGRFTLAEAMRAASPPDARDWTPDTGHDPSRPDA